MAVVPQGGFAYRQFRWPKFTGGLTFTQAQASDCVGFTNIDMQRDQFVRARKGIKRLNAAGAIGSAKVMGLSILSAGDTPVRQSRALLLVAKNSTTFYYTDIKTVARGGLATFSSFTVPAAPSGTQHVFMDAATNASGDSLIVMAHTNWAGGIVVWDGFSATASYGTGSPASTTLCAHTDGRIYSVPVSDQMSIRFSETDNPNSWPAANAIGITTQYGPIVRLVSLTDRILIFCQNGLLSLQGDPVTQPYVSIVHPSIGCSFPASLAVFGNTLVFMHGDNLYQYSGGASLLSDALRGIGVDLSSGPSLQVAGSLSPFHYMLHANTTASPTATARCLMYERIRYGQWSYWAYGSTTGFGSTVSDMASVLWCGYNLNGFVLDGGDGNLYNQEIYMRPDQVTVSGAVPGDVLTVGTDADSINVSATLLTRMEGLGDDLLVKSWRRLQILGTGTNVTCKLQLYDSAQNVQIVTMATGATMPLDLSVPAADGSATAPPTEFTQIQVLLAGDNLLVKDMVLDWRPSRYSLLTYS